MQQHHVRVECLVSSNLILTIMLNMYQIFALWLVCVHIKYSIPAGFLLVQPCSSPAFVPSVDMLTARQEHEWMGWYELMIRVTLWEIRPQTHTHSFFFYQGITMQ